MNRIVIVVAAAVLFANVASAETGCETKAVEKKLAGAAKTSFLKKCEKDAATAAPVAATSSCEAKASEKKLAGAAKNNFIKKCEKDAAK